MKRTILLSIFLSSCLYIFCCILAIISWFLLLFVNYIILFIIPTIFVTSFIANKFKLTNKTKDRFVFGILYGLLLSIIISFIYFNKFSIGEIIRNIMIIFVSATIIGFKSSKYLPENH